jgi:hypothetical protein
MSESSFPFSGGTAVATPPQATSVPDDISTGPDRNRLLVVGGALVVLVLGVVGYFLFVAGGDAAPAPAVTPHKSIAPSAPAEPATPSDTKAAPLKQRDFGRDPFHALIAPADPVGAVGGAGTSTVSGTTATGSTTDPAANPVTGSTTGGSAGGVSAPAQTTSHSFRVVAVAPNNSAVDVKVDGKVYRNLHAGEVFATYFKVVLISGTTNAFQYGEEKFNVLGTKRLTIA